MQRLIQTAAGALDALAIVSAVGVLALTAFLVVARLISFSVVGLHEVILLFALLMYMTGAVIASREQRHLTVDYLETRVVGRRQKALLKFVVAVVSAVIICFFIYWTYRMFLWGIKRPQATPAFGIPLWLTQISLVIGSVGCLLFCLRDMLTSALELGKPSGDTER